MSQALPVEQTNLQLGDIITFEAPNNAELNNRIFLIKYLDNEQLTLADEENLKEIVLSIDSDGNLTDETIESIGIIDRSEVPGYAKQNNLTPGEWINLNFGGDVPAIITGEITNLEEDMIEIKTYPDGDIIFIDFAYKGVPKDLPLNRIEIRQRPDVPNIPTELEELSETEEIEPSGISDLTQTMDMPEIKTLLKQMLFEGDQIQIGPELGGEVEQLETIAEDQFGYRITIQRQREDMKDDMLASIPNSQRTQLVLNSINRMIDRYTQLREEYTQFDEQGRAIKAYNQGSNYKPLVEKLKKLKDNLIWLLPVATNKKFLFGVDTPEQSDQNDYIAIKMKERLNETATILADFHSRQGQADNKYDRLINELYETSVPFITTDKNIQNVLDNLDVKTNLTTVIDNLDNFNASVYNDRSIPDAKKYLITKYELGVNRLELQKKRTGETMIQEKQIVEPQKVAIKGIVTLPLPLTHLSRAFKPGTNIMTRSQIASHYIGYWQILNKNTKMDEVIINNIDEEQEYHFENYLSNPTVYKLSQEVVTNDNVENKYERFLQSVIPRTRVLFELVKRHIDNAYSLYNILEYLEPFDIYHKNLSFKQYDSMTGYIRNKIKEYKKSLANINKLLKHVQNYKTREYFSDELIQLLDDSEIRKIATENNDNDNSNKIVTTEQIFILYGLLKSLNTSEQNNKPTPRETAEQLQQILKTDNGRAFTAALSASITPYMVPDCEMLQEMNDDIIEAERELYRIRDSDECGSFTLAKKYTSEDELLDDNNTEIYFDRRFDKTDYDLVKKFTQERKDLGESQFISFLTREIQKTNPNISVENAERSAEAILLGKKVVEDGDFAVLQTDDEDGNQKLQNYIRKGRQWVVSEITDNLLPVLDLGLFCTTSAPQCVPSNDECVDAQTLAIKKEADTLKQSIKFFAELYPKRKQQLNKYIQQRLYNAFDNLTIINQLQKQALFKYDSLRYQMGQTAESYEIVESPYIPLRDLILSQGDFVKRQYDIIKFKNQFTFGKIISDDPVESAWLYCNITNTHLLPAFMFDLANTFVYDNESYIYVLERLCKDIGKESDDGENWVDKYTGYVIRPKQFDTDEGYTQEGFKVRTREIMESQLASSVQLSHNKLRDYTSIEANKIANSMRALATLMSIDMSSKEDFIVRNVLEQLKKQMPSKETYEKAVAKRLGKQEKKVKIPSYEEAKDAKLLILMFSYFLIALQTAIPAITTEKTFPGCRVALHGYPIDGDQDKSAVQYIACLAQSLKKGATPWNSISGMNESTIMKQITNTIDTFILNDPAIQAMFDERKEYQLLEKKDNIPVELDVRKWVNFLPPLISPKPVNLQPLSSDFKNNLASDLKNGSNKQFDDIRAIQTKIVHFSIGIQKLIEKVITADDLLIRTNQYSPIQNTCCPTQTTNCFEYFVKKQPDISNFNERIKFMSTLLCEAGLYAKAPILYDPTDTKIRYPQLSNAFTEDTIVQAFIVYCRFSSVLPIPPELLPICKAKPEEFEMVKNETMNEKINTLLRSGRIYTKEMLDSLMSIINKRNIVHLDLDPETISQIENLRRVLENIKENKSSVIDSDIVNVFYDILDVFSLESPENVPNEDLRELRNLLSEKTNINRNRIFEFISRNAKLKTIDKTNKLKAFIENMITLPDTSPTALSSGNDNSMYRTLNFAQNIARLLCKVLPNMIINKIIANSPVIPVYWGLSNKHKDDLTNVFDNYYNTFQSFYDNKSISAAISQFKEKVAPIIHLFDNTVFLANKPGQDKSGTILDAYTVKLILNYYISVIFSHLIDSSNDITALTVNLAENAEQDDNLRNFIELGAAASGDVTSLELIAGEKKLLEEQIGQLLVTILEMIEKSKSAIDYSYDSVMEKVLYVKRRERDEFATINEDKTDDERHLNMLFKQAKLGMWGTGLRKGLTQYVTDTYDQEREKGEQELIYANRARNMIDANDQNTDILTYELMEQEQIAAREEADAYDMSMMAEDDDQGYDNDNVDY